MTSTMNLAAGGLAELCGRARPELACLGELAAPLVSMLGVVEQVGTGRGVEALGEPTFALDVLAAAGHGVDPAVVGRVLDFLRAKLTGPTSGPGVVAVAAAARRPVTVAEAVERYETTALMLLARNTQLMYRPWLHRLAKAHGREDPAVVTAGDLKELIAAHVVGVRERGHPGVITEEQGVTAFRALWTYLGDKRWAAENVAMRLRKPARQETARRGWRPHEAALARHLARGLKRTDPLLNEVTLCLSERMALRKEEGDKVRMCDINWDRAEAKVHGKGGKIRTVPIPPVFLGVLGTYVEQRRPAHIPAEVWQRSEQRLLRHRPSERFPEGRPTSSKRVYRLMTSLRQAAPDMFPADELFLHTYRHALANWCEANYSRTMARRALGHTSKQDPTDSYLSVTLDQLAEALACHEQHLLAADPHHQPDPPQNNDSEEVAA